MKPRTAVLIAAGTALIGGITLYIYMPAKSAQAPTRSPAPQERNEASLPNLITVSSPLPNTVVRSPLTLEGKARGNWFFEASAPVTLLDSNGNIVAQGHIEAQGEWMTSEYVAFKGVLEFTTPPTGTGVLVLKNDNPSGNPAREKELDIPVRFE